MYDKNSKTLYVHGNNVNIVLATIEQWLEMGARPDRIETSYGEHLVRYEFEDFTEGAYAFVDFPLASQGRTFFQDDNDRYVSNHPVSGFVFSLIK